MRNPHQLGHAYRSAFKWPRNDYERSAPLHAKQVNKWWNSYMRHLAKDHELERHLDAQLKWNELSSNYASVDAAPLKHCVSNVPPEHSKVLKDNGIIRQVRRNQIKRFGRALTTHEPATADRHRLRALLHPKQESDYSRQKQESE